MDREFFIELIRYAQETQQEGINPFGCCEHMTFEVNTGPSELVGNHIIQCELPVAHNGPHRRGSRILWGE